ncbi:hypothetical protein AND_003268 [Anopheles darlingi]|uniref:Uncharacterized protein n=1 Tax=Anopheles darlingi TaxID=43151 RepID=W5JNU1_ANODA|nr:hypothetical protein AND_003268 [Anopheles darlingi]
MMIPFEYTCPCVCVCVCVCLAQVVWHLLKVFSVFFCSIPEPRPRKMSSVSVQTQPQQQQQQQQHLQHANSSIMKGGTSHSTSGEADGLQNGKSAVAVAVAASDRNKRSKSPPRSPGTANGDEVAVSAGAATANASAGTGTGTGTGATIRGSGPNGELTLKDIPVSGISFQEIFKPDHEGPPTTQVIIYKPKSGKGQPTAKVIVTKVVLVSFHLSMFACALRVYVYMYVCVCACVCVSMSPIFVKSITAREMIADKHVLLQYSTTRRPVAVPTTPFVTAGTLVVCPIKRKSHSDFRFRTRVMRIQAGATYSH